MGGKEAFYILSGTLDSSQVYVPIPTSLLSDVQSAIEEEEKVVETLLLGHLGNGEMFLYFNQTWHYAWGRQTMSKTCSIIILGITGSRVIVLYVFLLLDISLVMYVF